MMMMTMMMMTMMVTMMMIYKEKDGEVVPQPEKYFCLIFFIIMRDEDQMMGLSFVLT